MFLLASALAPGQDQANSALSNIAEYGILGSFCVLLVIALFIATRGWLQEKDNRREDLSKMATAREKDNEALKALTIELKEHSTQLVLDARTSQDGMTNTLARQENAFDDLNRTVASLQNEQVKTSTAVENLKNEQVRLGAQLPSKG